MLAPASRAAAASLFIPASSRPCSRGRVLPDTGLLLLHFPPHTIFFFFFGGVGRKAALALAAKVNLPAAAEPPRRQRAGAAPRRSSRGPGALVFLSLKSCVHKGLASAFQLGNRDLFTFALFFTFFFALLFTFVLSVHIFSVCSSCQPRGWVSFLPEKLFICISREAVLNQMPVSGRTPSCLAPKTSRRLLRSRRGTPWHRGAPAEYDPPKSPVGQGWGRPRLSGYPRRPSAPEEPRVGGWAAFLPHVGGQDEHTPQERQNKAKRK